MSTELSAPVSVEDGTDRQRGDRITDENEIRGLLTARYIEVIQKRHTRPTE